MNKKLVIEVSARTIINFHSKFSKKLLCDGLTFTTGSACAFSCSFCYVADLMKKNPHKIETDLPHSEVVIRRRGALSILEQQLTKNGRSRFSDPEDRRVIYASPLVDVAGNVELARETIEVCRLILLMTHWQIRLLSKSNLLPLVADGLRDYRDRVIYGVSTGTLDDSLAGAYEQGTAKVSKRIESLRLLQDEGFRTFGMLCPSLPMENAEAYKQFAFDAAQRIRATRCEHIWAEPLNARGDSMIRTIQALRSGGFAAQADRLLHVSRDREAWEHYARCTYEAHAGVYNNTPAKLRFLQYTRKATMPYWQSKVGYGAVLLHRGTGQ